MQKDTRPSPIVFKLGNVEPTSHFVGMAFSWISFLILVDESNVHQFVEEMKLFTLNEFTLLNARVVNKRNKEVQMNEKHFIIMYAVIYFTSLVMVSEKETNFLLTDTEDSEDGFKKEEMGPIAEAYLSFSKNSIRSLKHDYKNNHHLAVAMAKIDAYTLPE